MKVVKDINQRQIRSTFSRRVRSSLLVRTHPGLTHQTSEPHTSNQGRLNRILSKFMLSFKILTFNATNFL